MCRLEAQQPHDKGRGGKEHGKLFCKIHGTMLRHMLAEIEHVSLRTLQNLRVLEKFMDALFLERHLGATVERAGVAATPLSRLTAARQVELVVECIVCLEPVELDVSDGGGFDCRRLWHGGCMSKWLSLNEDLEELKYLPSL